jgi:beta-aspartyl-peptidase (threonine type)
VWEQRLLEDMSQETVARLADLPDLWKRVEVTLDPERAKELEYFTHWEQATGTVNFIARDAQGHLCAGASTSGWAWKYPGRLGDSSVIGAGLYADDRYGAATCTGMGEMTIRACTAYSVVRYLKAGLSPGEAGRQAMADLNDLGGRYLSRVSVIVMDREGHHVGLSNTQESRSYIYLTGDTDEPVEVPYTFVRTRQRWGDRES